MSLNQEETIKQLIFNIKFVAAHLCERLGLDNKSCLERKSDSRDWCWPCYARRVMQVYRKTKKRRSNGH